ncbi:MAG: hypothetical protein AAF847_08950, partial [Bacteroidota bacterium]
MQGIRATSMLRNSLRTETQISTYFSPKNKLKFVFPSEENYGAYLLREFLALTQAVFKKEYQS